MSEEQRQRVKKTPSSLDLLEEDLEQVVNLISIDPSVLDLEKNRSCCNTFCYIRRETSF